MHKDTHLNQLYRKYHHEVSRHKPPLKDIADWADEFTDLKWFEGLTSQAKILHSLQQRQSEINRTSLPLVYDNYWFLKEALELLEAELILLEPSEILTAA